MINVNKFLIDNPAYDREDHATHHHPKTLLDWRWMKKFMKSCCDVRKSGPVDRAKLYDTLGRMYKLVVAKGSEDNLLLFLTLVTKFCKFIGKPEPELKGWLTEEEIAEYLTQ